VQFTQILTLKLYLVLQCCYFIRSGHKSVPKLPTGNRMSGIDQQARYITDSVPLNVNKSAA